MRETKDTIVIGASTLVSLSDQHISLLACFMCTNHSRSLQERERGGEYLLRRVCQHRGERSVQEKGEREMNMRGQNALVAMLMLGVCIVSTTPRGADAADFLFVQTASGATLNGTLTMTGVGQDTTYFSDRPVRVAGRMSTEEFLTLFEPSGTFSEVRLCHARVYVCVECTLLLPSTLSSQR